MGRGGFSGAGGGGGGGGAGFGGGAGGGRQLYVSNVRSPGQSLTQTRRQIVADGVDPNSSRTTLAGRT